MYDFLIRAGILYALIATVGTVFNIYINKKMLAHLPKKEKDEKMSVYYYYYMWMFLVLGFFPNFYFVFHVGFYINHFVSIVLSVLTLIVILEFLLPKMHLRLFMKDGDENGSFGKKEDGRNDE